MAILAGDTLFSKAFETVIRTKFDDSSYKRVNEALAVVVDSCIKICEGQACDMSFEEQFDVKESEYMDMIYKKTAALIVLLPRLALLWVEELLSRWRHYLSMVD